jgi:hypothetical protein
MLPAIATEMLQITIVNQRIEVCYGFNENATASATGTTIGPAVFNEFFTPKANAAIAAIAGLYVDFAFVKKFHKGLLLFVVVAIGAPSWRAL